MTPFERAERYTDKAAGVGQGGRNAACFNLAILLNQKFPELTGDEIAMLVGQWNQRNTPPLDESELQTTINSAARYPRPAAAPETASIDARSDAEILEAVLEMNELARASRATVTAANTPAQQSGFTLLSVSDLRTQFPDERAAVIEGLLRKGETMNVIGAAKSRKTWLLLSLMLSVASGRTWMGFSVQKGKVLHIDNELHGTTINKRITKVADGLGLTDQDYADNYRCRPLRGQLLNLTDIANKLTHTIKPGEYSLIVIDALYKALPSYVKDENDNAGMTRAFCELDQLAERFGCAIIVVHHQSKGNQAGKKVTDVGSGAGAQSRSVDTHLIVREHKEPNSVVMEAVARDFAPTPPVVLRWQYPLYTADPNGNPALLKEREIEIPTMPVSVFVDRIVGPKWVSKAVIAAKAIKNGISGREADRLIVEAIEDELLEVRGGSGKTPKEYRANTVNNDAPF
jgi:hypothetical protein